ncbi:MAG: hypothetical protein L3J10_06895 [Sulfurimonas sp.]|nr:hypothetical protein [Sulfurimonas sp.]
MIKYFLLFILPFSLYASKILSYNIYDRTDRVDVMITFDTPYNGTIKQSVGNSTITIKLEDATIESSKLKKLSSRYIKSLSITPMVDYTKIIAMVPPSVSLKASKTSDSYGLRLRFALKTAQNKPVATVKNKTVSPSLSQLPTKNDDMSKSYYIVIIILIIGIGVLLYIKKRVTPKEIKAKQHSWLYKDTHKEQEKTNETIPINNNDDADTTDNVSIRFQKSINKENSVIMLDFAEQSYLVLMGKNNILLDKYTDNKPETQNDFDSILQDRNKELNDFLYGKGETTKEPLQAYKERAASIAYES